GANGRVKKSERNDQVGGDVRVWRRRNFAGKNGIYNVRCHRLNCPTFLAKCVPVSFGCVSVS
ncbi:hypothetical protein QR685DRAFT_447264, partial [Neurospora intermedia]